MSKSANCIQCFLRFVPDKWYVAAYYFAKLKRF